MVKVSVVMPAKNEADALADLLPEIQEVMDGMGVPYEVIVADDGSGDGTANLLEDLSLEWPQLVGVVLRKGVGQTAALQAAFDTAQGEIVVNMDADGQNDPRDIPRMVAKLEEGYDVVSGWRKTRKDRGFSKRLPSWIANRLIKLISGTQLHDQGCALKAFRKDLLDEFRIYGEQHRYIAILAEAVGAKIAEVEVHHRPRLTGRSHYGWGRVPKVVLDLVFLKYIQSYSHRPLHLFGGGGLIAFGLGIFCCLMVTYDKIVYQADAADRPLLQLGILLILMGGLLVMLGILAELLVRTHHESTGVPIYRIRRKIQKRD
jgi:glycosyltransferase involved in cell wall biosynthesis